MRGKSGLGEGGGSAVQRAATDEQATESEERADGESTESQHFRGEGRGRFTSEAAERERVADQHEERKCEPYEVEPGRPGIEELIERQRRA